MSNQSSAKGNPASHRMSNPRRKARREACWARGQKRKQARKQAADAAQKRNVEIVDAKAYRAERRAAKRQAAA